MGVQRCRGTRDLSPDDLVRFHKIEGAFRNSCLKWGYKEVKTPVLEYLHLFTSAGTLTPSMLGKVYSFLDWDGWSGERVVLRPDITIPVARLYVDTMAEQKLAKLFYVANVFTYEECGKRSRERWQCGSELIGVHSPQADVELVTLALEVLGKLGQREVSLKLSHAGLVKTILQKLELDMDEQQSVIDQILDGDPAALDRALSDKPEIRQYLLPLLDMKGKSSGFIRNLKSMYVRDIPAIEQHLDEFISIVELLEAIECPYEIDIASMSGFEYYTGLIFQLMLGDEQIGGGGRYDDLIPAMGGSQVPASGFALYMDRMMDLLSLQPDMAGEDRAVLIRAVDGQSVPFASLFTLAQQLRAAGYIAELKLGGEKSSDYRWKLEVQTGAPLYILTDRLKRRKHEAGTVEELLAVLQK